MRVYTARWLVPVSSPPVPDGAVAVENGTIVAAGREDRVREAAGDAADVRELGDAVIFPGLVNAHTHVELSWMGDDPPPGGDFPRWVRGLIERREREEPEHARKMATAAIESMLRRGTVAIGDVSNDTWVVPLLVRSELSGIAFHEMYAFRGATAADRMQAAVEQVEAFAADADVANAGGRWRIVPTAHAPHTTSAPLIRSLANRAASLGDPFSIHVAESEPEVALLRDGTGAFRDLYRERGMWDEQFTPPGLGSIEYLDRLGALTDRTLAVHCVRMTRSDHSKLQQRGATVVTCPRSNRRLGLGTAPVPQVLAEGIPVALGTDSLASAPDLDLLEEMAALREEHPSLTAPAVLRMATLNGAAALGLSDRFGSIEPGKSDRIFVLPLTRETSDPAGAVCSAPSEVYRLEEAPVRAGA